VEAGLLGDGHHRQVVNAPQEINPWGNRITQEFGFCALISNNEILDRDE
jgi:hypothetical protein